MSGARPPSISPELLALRVRHSADGALAYVRKERYTSPEFAALEWERMWTRRWLLAGPDADVAAPGSFLVFDIGPESILVVRDAGGELRAFYNVCRHRGNRLRARGRGRCESFTCAYHHWTYDLGGQLASLPDPQSFPGLDKSALALRTVRCESFGGFVWINMDPQAEPLRAFLGPMAGELERFEAGAHALVRDVTVELNCNWKAFVDNSDETYHVQAVHPHLLDLLDDYDVRPRLHPRHSSFVVRFGAPSHRRTPSPTSAGLREMLTRAGVTDADLAAGPAAARSAFERGVRARFQKDGIDYPAVPDDVLADNYHGHVYPHALFNVVLPELWIFRVRPHPAGPDRAYFDFQEYRRLRPGESRPARPEHRLLPAGEGIDRVVDQDTSILASVQRGMHSRGLDELVLGAQESRLRHLHETLDADLFGDAPAPTTAPAGD